MSEDLSEEDSGPWNVGDVYYIVWSHGLMTGDRVNEPLDQGVEKILLLEVGALQGLLLGAAAFLAVANNLI